MQVTLKSVQPDHDPDLSGHLFARKVQLNTSAVVDKRMLATFNPA